MTLKPLDILKKGFSEFTNTIKASKDELNTKLARKETISSVDEHWLDHEANMVDEQSILEILESASDYDRGLEQLDEKGKAIVKTLREWAGDLVKATGNERKMMSTMTPQRDLVQLVVRSSRHYQLSAGAPKTQMILFHVSLTYFWVHSIGNIASKRHRV
jgi:hypothetical protein